MTPEEAIEELKIVKNQVATVLCDTPQCRVRQWPMITDNAFDMAFEALQDKSEAEKYRTPMKMRFDWWPTAGGADYTLVCPRCGKEPECDDFFKRLPFCAYCGQALDWNWSEEEG